MQNSRCDGYLYVLFINLYYIHLYINLIELYTSSEVPFCTLLIYKLNLFTWNMYLLFKIITGGLINK